MNGSEGAWTRLLADRRGLSESSLARLLGGLLLLAIGLRVAAASLPFDADLYDEGLIAQGAALALHGQQAVAHFYAPYPPGAFCALALAFRVWGVRLIVERWFAAVVAALVAPLGFWLISGLPPLPHRASPRQLVFTWMAALAISLLLAARWVTPVNGGALALVLLSGLALRASLPRGRLEAAFLCGAITGAAALFRLDFGFYGTVAGLLVWLLCAGHETGGGLSWRARLAGAVGLGLGTLAVMGPPLAWILIRGGERAADCLFLWPITSTAAHRLPWTHYWSAFLMPLTAALLLAHASSRLRRAPRQAAIALWLLFVGLGFLAYSLGRTHPTHLLPLRVVSLLLAGLCVGVEREASVARTASPPRNTRLGHDSFRIGSFAFLAMVVATAVGPIREFLKAPRHFADRRVVLPGPRGEGVYPAPRRAKEYDRIIDYLDREVPPGARLYCGAARHDLFLKDDNLAYFLSGRESGTYYWCLDAGVTSTAPVQAQMVREMEASRVEVVLIRTAVANHEPNAGSRSSGVHLLDNYLHRCFRRVTGWDDDQIYRRTPDSLAARVRSAGSSTPRPAEPASARFIRGVRPFRAR